MSERTKVLKKNVHIKAVNFREFKSSPIFRAPILAQIDFRPGTKLCLERARLITQYWQSSEGEPVAIRRAKALTHILHNVTVYIQDGELIVGNFASTPYSLPLHPDLGDEWVGPALDNGLREMLDEEEKREYRGILDYWKDKSLVYRMREALPEHLKPYTGYNGAFYSWAGRKARADETPNLKELLSIGLNGIIRKIKARMRWLESHIDELDPKDYIERKRNLEAMAIALKAGIKFSKRYANEARRMARKEKDEKRKTELLKIAEVCDWVPGNPPRTIWEALQAFFFINLIPMQYEFHGQGFGNRLDVLLNPIYQKEKEEGKITYEEAQELMECFLIKLSERGHLVHPNAVGASSGNSDWTDITICGMTTEGDDATNEVSFMVLDAAKEVQVPVPTIALRYHPKISEEVILKAIDVLRTGIGYPAFFNDSAAIPWLMGKGASLEHAREWVIPSCVNAQIPGMATRTYWAHVGNINFSKCLELALYQGKDKPMYTGKQIGTKTDDPRTFSCIEDMMDAYLAQVRFIGNILSKMTRIAFAVVDESCRRPFASAFIDGCIEEGKDCASYHRGHMTTTLDTGLTNVADSLGVIKKLVFDDQAISMNELIDACWNNWEGKEELRQICINKAPKFGNGEDYADLIARDVHLKTNAELMKCKCYHGSPIMVNGSVAGGYYGFSKACGATPDGRKDGESLADALISPMAGRDRKGPTAVLQSVGKITPTYNNLLNQKFLPTFLEGQNKVIFAKYLKTWADLGCYHIQFNVVNRDTLLDAQAHPENYTDLIVRVAGYSAYFVDLEKGQQDDIIQRTEQSFQ